MRIYDSLVKKYLDDLQNPEGLRFPKFNKESGSVETATMPFDDILRCYCTLTIPKKVFLSKYENLQQIELLEENDFLELEHWAWELFGEKGTEKAMDCMRVIHTIGILSN